MQIYKDHNLLYDSIDNTGTADNASFSSRYVKGLLDTLNGRFGDYFDKAEILDLLAQKVGAEFVDELPSTLESNVWYYSKKFADGSEVPNEKRALYTKDTNDIVQYLGIMGDVDLSNYYNKESSDERYLSLIDACAPLAGDYDSTDTGDPISVDDCVFDMKDANITGSNVKVTQRQLFLAYLPAGADTIQPTTKHYGTVEVIEYFDSNGNTCHFEQRFTKRQAGNVNTTYTFVRKGNISLADSQAYKNTIYSRRAEISWKAWKIVDYPPTLIYNYNGAEIRAAVRGGMCYLDLSGNFTPRYTNDNQHIIGYTNYSQLRPPMEVHGTIQNLYGQAAGQICTFWIQTNGEIKAFTLDNWSNIRGSITYPIGY